MKKIELTVREKDLERIMEAVFDAGVERISAIRFAPDSDGAKGGRALSMKETRVEIYSTDEKAVKLLPALIRLCEEELEDVYMEVMTVEECIKVNRSSSKEGGRKCSEQAKERF